MKFSLKSIASAVVLAVAVSGAHAAIDAGATGNGELFLNVWDGAVSYTFDLNKTIDAFQSDLAAVGKINQTYALSNFSTFLTGSADSSLLKFNVLAADASGARRALTTFSQTASPIQTNSARSATGNISGFASAVNAFMGTGDSISVGSSSTAYAGKATMGSRIAGNFNFDTNGKLGTNFDYASGIGFERIDAPATGGVFATYNVFKDEGADVRVWIEGSNLRIQAAAVPEPESYAMLLAGLGMIGLIARRNKRA